MTIDNKIDCSVSTPRGITAIKCCKDCTERHPLCHSHCENYITERVLLDRYKDDVRRENQVDAYNKQRTAKIKTFYAKKSRNHHRMFHR